MSRERLTFFGLLVVVTLAAAGVATAGALRGPTVQAASATFDAMTVAQRWQVTCSVNGGNTFKATNATYTGTAVSSDPRLAGALTIRAWSLVDTTSGVGHVFGVFHIRGAEGNHAHGKLNAALADGKASGLARGWVRGRHGRLVASLGSSFDPSTGFSSGSLGGSTTGAGFIRSGRWCHPPHWPSS